MIFARLVPPKPIGHHSRLVSSFLLSSLSPKKKISPFLPGSTIFSRSYSAVVDDSPPSSAVVIPHPEIWEQADQHIKSEQLSPPPLPPPLLPQPPAVSIPESPAGLPMRAVKPAPSIIDLHQDLARSIGENGIRQALSSDLPPVIQPDQNMTSYEQFISSPDFYDRWFANSLLKSIYYSHRH